MDAASVKTSAAHVCAHGPASAVDVPLTVARLRAFLLRVCVVILGRCASAHVNGISASAELDRDVARLRAGELCLGMCQPDQQNYLTCTLPHVGTRAAMHKHAWLLSRSFIMLGACPMAQACCFSWH